jgi:hypothetical protein
VTEQQLALASEAWAAFRAPTPEPWAELLKRDLSALPYLRASVQRMLEELPGADGLSRTERQSLAVLAEGGTTPVALFAAVQRQEEAAFMGDWSFFGLLNDLALARKPLIDGLMGAPFRPNGSRSTQPYLQSTLTLTHSALKFSPTAPTMPRRTESTAGGAARISQTSACGVGTPGKRN